MNPLDRESFENKNDNIAYLYNHDQINRVHMQTQPLKSESQANK